MDSLKDKQTKNYNYTSRYNPFYLYYNNNDNKYMYGLTSHLEEDTPFTEHVVKDTDTLDSLALKYYGRPDLFWVIADFNRILDSYAVLYNNYKTIKIPSLSGIRFI